MKSIAIFLILSVFYPCDTWSQSGALICGNQIFSSILDQHYPDLDEAFRHTFSKAAHTSPMRQGEELTVQVFVHIVWKFPWENLHDSIIEDQIRILNEDFNRMNADTHQLRQVFAAEAGAADIRFELAGIQRVQTTLDFEINPLGTNLLAEVKHTSQGGSDAVDPEQYLNVWVCHIQPIEIFGIVIGQVLGFAFPPNDLPHWPPEVGAPSPEEDGVVIDYRVFGSNNPNTIEIPGTSGPLTVKGRTPVHEVGHYFGLRHIWGDGGLLGPNDCAQSDGIADTPYANAQSAFDCDTTRNSCTGIELHYGEDVPDLIENYMDYAREDCMNMFTKGQCDLMRNVLLGPRSGLLGPFSSTRPPAPLSDFSLYPNPARDILHISFTSAREIHGQWRVFSITGSEWLHHPPVRYEAGYHVAQLDLSSFSPGLYMLCWQHDMGVVSRRFIKAAASGR